MSSPSVVGMLESIERRAAHQKTALLARLEQARASGRTEMTVEELRAEADWHALEDRADELRSEAQRSDISGLQAIVNRGNTQKETRAMGTTSDNGLVYRKSDTRTSYARDLIRAKLGLDDDYTSRNRLAAHAEQVANDPRFLEARDISRTDGAGGYAVAPLWLEDQYIELARPGRAFANLCQRQQLPPSTDSINIPKLLSGTEVAIQTADNQPVAEVDLTDTFVNAPVRTIAGQQSVAIQLLDQSPIQFDQVVFGDLIAAHATATDLQVLNGNGNTGQVLGVNHTPGISTIAVSDNSIQGIYRAIANAIQTIHTTRFLPPQVICMHPRRWGWLQSLLDTTDRPLFLPYAQNPQNAGGILTDVDSQQVVGSMMGLPIVTDPNITTTAGSGSGGGTEDVIYVMRSTDLLLWESGIRARVLQEPKASNLTVILQVFNYVAFTGARQPQSVCTITGLTAPTF